MTTALRARDKYRVRKCPCGDRICNDWHVSPVADVWGVSLTEEQALLVASLLNVMEDDDE
jgi:hypothetical protein